MCKILKGIAMLFLMTFLHANVIHADETGATANSDAASSEVSQQDLAATPRAISGGTGTAKDPFLVSNVSELQNALSSNITTGESSIYIKMISDLTYSDTNININKNTVLDGDGHYILYTGNNYDTSRFSSSSNNIKGTSNNYQLIHL